MSAGSSDAPSAARVRGVAATIVDGVALLAALGLLAATAAALAAKTWWGFELFAHFRAHYVLLALPLCAALVALGRRRVAAVLALAIVPNAWPLLPYLSAAGPAPAAVAANGSGRASDAASATVKLLAVNVEWRNRSSERLLELIRAESPDAVLVVEYTDEWGARLEPIFADYPYRVQLPDERAFGIALLSRLPLRDVRPFLLESTPAIDATLVAPAGALRLIGVHLRPPTDPRSAAERDRQLDALAALVARIDGPLVVAGDFNLTPYSPYFEDLVDATGLRDSRTGSGPGFTWPSFFPLLGIPIDHCLVSPDVHVAAFRRLSAFGSDHYPIVVELAVSAPDRETLP